MKKNHLDIYIDGASKGNPGHSGVGAVVCRGETVVKNISAYIGETTNNCAEYTALIYALQEALLFKAQSLAIFTDSELIFRQLKGQYRVKNATILVLYSQVKRLIAGFKEFEITHIPREKNRGADKLANLAVEAHLKNHN